MLQTRQYVAWSDEWCVGSCNTLVTVRGSPTLSCLIDSYHAQLIISGQALFFQLRPSTLHSESDPVAVGWFISKVCGQHRPFISTTVTYTAAHTQFAVVRLYTSAAVSISHYCALSRPNLSHFLSTSVYNCYSVEYASHLLISPLSFFKHCHPLLSDCPRRTTY